MSNKSVKFGLISLVLALVLTSVTLAQVSNGVVLGTVRDASGGVVPGVDVVVTDVATGAEHRAITGSHGNYRVVNLSPGEYSVRAEMPGFQTQLVEGIVLQVAQRARIDVTLAVGEVTQEVTVQGTTPIIETDNATVGEVIDSRKVLELPLNGRQFLQLATLTPGVRKGYGLATHTQHSGGNVSANSLSNISNNVLIDGIMNQESGAGRMTFSPSLDLIQEFKIQTNVYDSEFGRSGGAQITILTKRGSLDYHGSLYMFHRNDNQEARNFFSSGAPPEFRRSQFGGSFGGHIPGTEKHFFFLNYEANREGRGLTVPISVPSAAMKAGDFSDTGTTIYDPLTLDPETNLRQPFPGNIIPANRISQQASYINQFLPDPQRSGYSGNFISNPTRGIDRDEYSARYDGDLSDTDTITFRYTWQDAFILEPVPNTWNTPIDGFRENQSLNGENHKFGWTHTFSPTAINTFSFGFSQYHQLRDNEPTVDGLYVSGGSRGAINGPDLFAGANIKGVSSAGQAAGVPLITITGWVNISDNPFSPVNNPYNNYQYNNTFNKVQGNHSWKVGVEAIHNGMEMDFDLLTRGWITFSPTYSRQSPGISDGNNFTAFADYLTGAVNNSLLFTPLLTLNTVQQWTMFFAQDDWQVSPDLTINFGMRYELWDRPYDTGNRIAGVDVTKGVFVYPGSVPTLPGTATNAVTAESFGYDRSLQRGDGRGSSEKNDFGPRFGFAWRMFGNNKTVLRGGYGIFYGWQVLDIPIGMGIGKPFVHSIGHVGDPDYPIVTFEEPFGIVSDAPVTGGSGLTPDNHTPYLQQYSLSIARELTPTLGAEFAFVGNAGRKNLMNYGHNNPFPGPEPIQERRAMCVNGVSCAFGGIGGAVNWGTSNYSAFQVKVRKEVGPEGLLLLAAYSWGKGLGTSISGPQIGENYPYRNSWNWKDDAGPIPHYDIRHLFSISGVYELPFGRGKPAGGGMSRTADLIAGGWKLGGIASFQSGQFLTPTDVSNTSNAGGSRPNLLSNPNGLSHSSRQSKLDRFFDTSVFERAEIYTFGNAGTGTIVGPGLTVWDLSLYKDFHVSENHRVQFRVEFFNAFNNVNLNNPGTAFGSSGFGRITSTRSEADARQIQFGLRYDF